MENGGSGKTHFWNNKVKNKIESLTLNGKKYKPIYMSLYGISNLEEISKKIFLETTQLMDRHLKRYMREKEISKIPEYAKTSMDMASIFGLKQGGERIDYETFFSAEDKVLCFDDLERANVDVIDILGYINKFVEHDHIKTIIICNEKELATKLKNTNIEFKTFISTYILDKEGQLDKKDIPLVEKIKEKTELVFDKANDYERIKEKLIGETFEYAPKFNYIINGILLRYEKNQELIRFLRSNTGIITNTFMRSGTRNLRILKHALNDFEKIFNIVNLAYPDTSFRVIQTMLIFTIATSFEIKSGKIIRYKFESIKNNEEYRQLLVSSRVLKDNKQFYIKEFDNNYYYNFKSEYKFFKFIEMYIRTRIFDMKVFKKDMEEIIMTIDTKKLPGYKRLLTEEYWKISDDEFPKIIAEILEDIEQGKLTLIDIVKIYAYFIYFKEKGLITYVTEELEDIFINGMNKSAKTSKYCEKSDEEIQKIGLELNEKVDRILEHFNNLNKEIYKQEKLKLAEEIFKNIPMKMEKFYEEFETECMEVPIFKYYEVIKLFQRITCASNEDIVIIGDKLKQRAKKFSNIHYIEKQEMIELKEKLLSYVDNKQLQIKIVMIYEFIDKLDYIIKKYEKYEKTLIEETNNKTDIEELNEGYYE